MNKLFLIVLFLIVFCIKHAIIFKCHSAVKLKSYFDSKISYHTYNLIQAVKTSTFLIMEIHLENYAAKKISLYTNLSSASYNLANPKSANLISPL